jgi:A nuclease family of the HNH/ENDO VII superfamily with conserved AHH
VKSDWEGVVDILKMPVQLYEAFTSPFKAASELYNTFKVLKGLTLEDVKGIAKTMFDEFISNQEARLAWPEPAGASDALKSYMGGYLGGYIGEQVAIAFLTAGGGVAVKAGKYIRTIIEKVRQGVKIVGAMTLIEGRLPKMFTQAVAKITSDEDLLRRIRAVSSRVKSVPMQARFARSCVDDLAVSANTARSRLRSSLGGVVGDGLEGHHLISWEHRNHNLVQKAARGGFNINNGGHNGVMLDPAIHQGVRGHPSYNEAIGNLLDALEREAANLTDAEAADLLIRNAGLLRMTILNTGHPLTMNRPKAGESETTLLAHQRQTRNPNKATFIFAYAMGQSAA